MRNIVLVILLGGSVASAQTMLEAGAAAAGGTAGGVAGKKVSDGLTRIFGKVDEAAGKSAREAKDANPATPLLEVGPGTPKSDGSAVPPPPPAHHASNRRPAPAAPAPPPAVETPIPVPPPPPPPPPPEMTAQDMRQVTIGMTRGDVLKLGEPASRTTMFEEDRLVEIFHYVSKDANLGTIRLSNGAVASVQLP
jgi:hypothetical protein